MPTSTALLDTYARITSILGFGLHSDAALRKEAGATWGDIHALTDAGLIRCERVLGNSLMYRLFFP